MSFVESIIILLYFLIPFLGIMAVLAFIEEKFGPKFFPRDFFKSDKDWWKHW